MTSIEKLNFLPLTIEGENYLSWSLDVKSNLIARDIKNTITTDQGTTIQQKAKALVFIRHHLVEPLKLQYLNEDNPKRLWDQLKDRFDHTKTIHLPRARHDWVNLRVQDHTSIANYNSELFRIISQLTLCGQPISDEEQIEKTLSTMHSSNMILSSQYRNMQFTRYSELIAHMLLAERHQELLLRNSKMRPLAPYKRPHQPRQTSVCPPVAEEDHEVASAMDEVDPSSEEEDNLEEGDLLTSGGEVVATMEVVGRTTPTSEVAREDLVDCTSEEVLHSSILAGA